MATKDMYKDRSRIIQGVFILAAAFLVLSALNIQVIDPEYRERAQATTVNKYTLYPSRGLIYDRNGKLLVINNAIYDLKVTYKQLDPAMDTMHLCLSVVPVIPNRSLLFLCLKYLLKLAQHYKKCFINFQDFLYS